LLILSIYICILGSFVPRGWIIWPAAFETIASVVAIPIAHLGLALWPIAGFLTFNLCRLLGVGGSAGNCSHAVNDFRKLCGIEAYSPIDNVSELTARTNDEGWDSVFAAWLETSRLDGDDAILIFSVGGGDAERNVSTNLVSAIDLAKKRAAKVFGIVGKDTGYTARHGDVVVVIPQVNPAWVTPLSEAFQAVVWHCLVSHPKLQKNATKW
jgi:D-sedoheptulose 7-phosphate isomerase